MCMCVFVNFRSFPCFEYCLHCVMDLMIDELPNWRFCPRKSSPYVSIFIKSYSVIAILKENQRCYIAPILKLYLEIDSGEEEEIGRRDCWQLRTRFGHRQRCERR